MRNLSTASSKAVAVHAPRDKSSLAQRAEDELAAFHRAVSELYGSEEATLAAADWLRAFEAVPAKAESFPWNSITVTAASRLAERKAPRGPLGRIRQLIGKRAGHSPCFCSCNAK